MVTDLVAIGIALLALITTIIYTRININLNKLVALIQVIWQEMSNQEASIDRGLVREIKSSEVGEIKRLISMVRENATNDERKYGEAAERTIAVLTG